MPREIVVGEVQGEQRRVAGEGVGERTQTVHTDGWMDGLEVGWLIGR